MLIENIKNKKSFLKNQFLIRTIMWYDTKTNILSLENDNPIYYSMYEHNPNALRIRNKIAFKFKNLKKIEINSMSPRMLYGPTTWLSELVARSISLKKLKNIFNYKNDEEGNIPKLRKTFKELTNRNIDSPHLDIINTEFFNKLKKLSIVKTKKSIDNILNDINELILIDINRLHSYSGLFNSIQYWQHKIKIIDFRNNILTLKLYHTKSWWDPIERIRRCDGYVTNFNLIKLDLNKLIRFSSKYGKRYVKNKLFYCILNYKSAALTIDLSAKHSAKDIFKLFKLKNITNVYR